VSTDLVYVIIIVAYLAATLIDMMAWALKKLRRQKRIEIKNIDASTADTQGQNGFACMPVGADPTSCCFCQVNYQHVRRVLALSIYPMSEKHVTRRQSLATALQLTPQEFRPSLHRLLLLLNLEGAICFLKPLFSSLIMKLKFPFPQ
jgi:hypothetical protein